MTVVCMDAAGFAAARDRLAEGEPVVIPTPSPLAYLLFADDPRSVNTAEGRDVDQAVGVTPNNAAVIRPHLAVDLPTDRLIEWLMFDQHSASSRRCVRRCPIGLPWRWLTASPVHG